MYLIVWSKGSLIDLMVAYLTNARLNIVKRREGYVSWGVENIFLTPALDWIQDCIPDWTRDWNPSLNTSTVWSNLRQGIIAMLSGGMAGRIHDPSRGERKKVETLEWRLNVLPQCFWISPYFLFPNFPSSNIWRSERLRSEGNQKYRLCLAQPLIRISYTTLWSPI